MAVTKADLRQIIREEIRKVLTEQQDSIERMRLIEKRMDDKILRMKQLMIERGYDIS